MFCYFILLIILIPGYGNLTPHTSLGKVVTIIYALVGIPLMFIYMANIGTILATSFKYSYSKLCRYVKAVYHVLQSPLPGVRGQQTCPSKPPCPPSGQTHSAVWRRRHQAEDPCPAMGRLAWKRVHSAGLICRRKLTQVL